MKKKLKSITKDNLILSIKQIKSNNLYYIENRIKKLILENNISIDMNLNSQIYDFLDFKSEQLNQEIKCISLHNLLNKDLD